MTTFSDQVFQFGGVPCGAFGTTDGKWFFVDPGLGSDSNSGEKPTEAFASLQMAVDSCTDNRGDVIVRLPGSETPSAVITMDCAGVTVISSAALFGYGMNYQQAEKFSTYPASTYATGPMVIITQPCALIGLEFVSRVTSHGTTADCSDAGAIIAIDGDAGGYAGGFSLIKDCRLVDWWGTPYGIYFRCGAYNKVEGCNIEGFTAGVAFQAGTRNADYNQIVGNHFVDCTSGIEHLAATPHNFLYKSNTFIDCTDSFDSGNFAADGLLCDNWMETATDTSSYDQSVATMQGNGINFSDQHYSE